MIIAGELFRWGKYALFGVAMWLIYQGIFNAITEWGITSIQSVLLGFGLILAMLTFWKFKGVFFG